jgi:hypothetical protein
MKSELRWMKYEFKQQQSRVSADPEEPEVVQEQKTSINESVVSANWETLRCNERNINHLKLGRRVDSK